MSNIKKTPLEHALELIQAQKAWIMAVPDDTVLPTMPGFDRERADRLEAFLAKQVDFEKSLNNHPEHDALVAAITMCPHTIEGDRVTLEWDGKKGVQHRAGSAHDSGSRVEKAVFFAVLRGHA